MKVTEELVLNYLSNVVDPEIGINIVDLGLIYGIELDENKIKVTMTLTTPGCPMHGSMISWVQETLTHIDSSVKVEVNLVWQPPWTPELMSEDAKHQLGRYI